MQWRSVVPRRLGANPILTPLVRNARKFCASIFNFAPSFHLEKIHPKRCHVEKLSFNADCREKLKNISIVSGPMWRHLRGLREGHVPPSLRHCPVTKPFIRDITPLQFGTHPFALVNWEIKKTEAHKSLKFRIYQLLMYIYIKYEIMDK